MRRYPGNHTDSELLTVPRFLKTRPQAPTTHLAYITDDEADLLKDYKPGTPHEGAEGIPNYDTWGIDSSGTVTGGSTAGGGGAWSGDTGGGQSEPEPWNSGNKNQNQNEYLNDASNFKTSQQQMAESLKAAGAVTSGALGGQALWTKTPPGFYGSQYPDQYGLPENQYFSSFAKGTQAYSPTGIIEITGPGALYENGRLVWGEPANYKVINPYGGSGGGGGGGGWGGYGGYGYGGGGGGGGGGYGGELPEKPMFPGQPGERWGQQNPLQQMMINIHGGPGFQQGFARGGIVGLVT